MKTFRLLVFPIIILFSFSASGQGWDTVFPSDSVIGTTGLSIGFDVGLTQDGGYLLAGEVDYPTGAIRHFIRLAKTDEYGNEEWSQTYKIFAVANEQVAFVSELPNGEIIVGGRQNNYPYLMKTNSEGESIWENTFESDTTHNVQEGYLSTDGNIILAGYTSGLVQFPFILKFNLDGELIWQKYISSVNQFVMGSIQPTSDGGFILVGNLGVEISLLKLDSLGEIEWSQAYEFSTYDQGYAVAETLDKGFLLGGSIQGIMDQVPFVFKVDSLGNGEWVKFLEDGVLGQVTDVAVKTDSSYLVTGDINFFFDFERHGFVTQLDKQGEVLWQEDFTSNGQFFSKLKLTSDDGIILSGSQGQDMLLKKLGGTTSQKNIFSKSELKIFPNPLQHHTTFKFENINFQTIHLQVFDLMGKVVHEENYPTPEFIFYSKNLTSGIYFYKIKNENSLIAHGKLLIQK